MIRRAIIRVDGPSGAGKTTFVERVLHGTGAPILAARCRRDASLRDSQAAAPATHPELGRYRAAGALGATLFTFGDADPDGFFSTRLMMAYAKAVVLEGDSPLSAVDLGVFVAPPLGPGGSLLVRTLRDRAKKGRERADAMQRLLRQPDGVAQLLDGVLGGPVGDFARQRPELLEQARTALLAGIGKARKAPPPAATEHWAVSGGYDGIQHAQLVVVNVRDAGQRERAYQLVGDVQRLRADRGVFDDVLGWRGSRIPVTAVVADLWDARDAGTRKAVARVERSIRSVSDP